MFLYSLYRRGIRRVIKFLSQTNKNNLNPIAGANVIYIFQGATLLGLFFIYRVKKLLNLYTKNVEY